MKVSIEFQVELPDVGATEEEIEEYLRYELNDNGSMSTLNPLYGKPVEPIFGTFWWEKKP